MFVPGKPKLPDQDIPTLELQFDRWNRASAGQLPWAEVAKTCTDFVEGKQWTDAEKAQMKKDKRPYLTINKTKPLVKLLRGYFKQNQNETRALPAVDSGASNEIAQLFSMTIKQISEANQTPWNDAEVFGDGLVGGRGYWDLRMDYEHNDFGEVRERVLDPASVYPDPEGTDYDPNQWGFWQQASWMSPEQISADFGIEATDLLSTPYMSPLASRSGYGLTSAENDVAPERTFGLDEDMVRETFGYGTSALAMSGVSNHINRQRRLIRVIECQHKIPERRFFFVDLETGDKKAIPKNWSREQIGATLAKSRAFNLPIDVKPGVHRQVYHTYTAADVLLWNGESPYDTYSLIPFFAYFRRGKTMGMVEDLLDPQREINKRRSNLLHILTTVAHSGWKYEKGALSDEMKNILKQFGARPGLNIEYETGKEPPSRIEPANIPAGFKLAEDSASNDMREVSLINEAALGQQDRRAESGRAILARQQQAVVGGEEYFDNFKRSLELKGRKIIELVQKNYTEPRLIRITGPDGKDQQTMINIQNAAGEIVANNITTGKYRVAVDTRPMSATFLDAQFEEAIQLREAGVPVPEDMLVDLSSMPRKDEIKKRLEEQRQAQVNPPEDPQIVVAKIRAGETDTRVQGDLQKAQIAADVELEKEDRADRRHADELAVKRDDIAQRTQTDQQRIGIDRQRLVVDTADKRTTHMLKGKEIQSNRQVAVMTNRAQDAREERGRRLQQQPQEQRQ